MHLSDAVGYCPTVSRRSVSSQIDSHLSIHGARYTTLHARYSTLGFDAIAVSQKKRRYSMPDHDDPSSDAHTPDPLPDETPGQQNPANERIAWALVIMIFLATFVWPVAFEASIPSGTVAALLTAVTTLLIARRVA